VTQASATTFLIIPAYNEGGRIGEVLRRVRAAGFDGQVVVIDDGSKDGTGAEARAEGARVVAHPFNLGYGAALQTGYKAALDLDARYVVQMDADGQHDPENIALLLRPILNDQADVVVGSRFKDETGYQMGAVRSLGRRVFASIARLAGLRVSDPTSGFQAMNRHVLELYAGDFFPADYPDVDVLLTAFRHGMRVAEESVRMSEGVRPSTMHGGLGSFYYVYKMLLSIWAVSGSRRRVHRAPAINPLATETREDSP
jgi:hypothetical protein